MAKMHILSFALFALSTTGTTIHRSSKIPQGWHRLSTGPSENNPLDLSIALRQHNVKNLKNVLAKRNAEGRHLSPGDVHALRSPAAHDTDSVLNWLNNNGVSDVTLENDWIHVRTTVGEAETLLNTTISRYAYQNGPPVLRTELYNTPDSVADAISFIHPLDNFMRPYRASSARKATMIKRDDTPTECELKVKPSCVSDLYKINYDFDKGDSPSRIGIAGFLDQYAGFDGAHKFLEVEAPNVAASGYNFTVELINGSNNPQDQEGLMSMMNVEYIMALGYPTNITFFSTEGRRTVNDSGLPSTQDLHWDEPYLQLLDYLLAKPDEEIPHVLTIPYSENEIHVPRQYAERACDMFGLLTARGTTILAASGDNGATGGGGERCQNDDGTPMAQAEYPGTCPWVTSVGAAYSYKKLEAAAYSGGGFSQYFAQEDWQKETVAAYVASIGELFKGKYNPNNRAVPDISAIGENFVVFQNGRNESLSGSGSATTIVAAMLGLVNDARLREGKRSLGWINKLLYTAKVRDAFEDVTVGQSLACFFEPGANASLWTAEAGWDAMSGLGVPSNFPKLLQVLKDA